MELTEKTLQDALYIWCNSCAHRPIVPNCHALGHEADLLSVTPALLTHEFEVKVTRADYKADTKGSVAKWSKHERLAGRGHRHGHWSGWRNSNGRIGCPNYFWYATPEGLLDGLELPDYAGHMVIKRARFGLKAVVVKKAPRLHTDKIAAEQLVWLAGSLQARYWKLRHDRRATEAAA